ncbi:MAG: hypothetical protein HZB31_04275 [Nitrospirae bacterium]|nr:hypothetical protein [Nitrospirota bacterium]
MMRRIYGLLSSVKLAMGLLIAILISCVVGVTIFRGERAWELIFNSLWFNGLLVLLVLNVAFCFFGRIWGRKVTLISLGMILFHLSFVTILVGIVYNSFFYFRGTIRLTESETLPNADPMSYDVINHGRFFDLSRLKGNTTLIKMHRGYKVDGTDKRAGYEIEVGEGIFKKQDIIYVTHHLEYRGFKYFNDKEGYSLLIILYDKLGRELYGGHVPLQSFKQKDETYLYSTGTKEEGPGGLAYPQDPVKPLFGLQATYEPSKFTERAGDTIFTVWPLVVPDEHKAETLPDHGAGQKPDAPDPHANMKKEDMAAAHSDGKKTGTVATEKPLAEGKVPIGKKIRVGDYYLEAREVRYWVAMSVRYDPGQPIVLASLWIGLGGMVITFIGRIRRSRI